MSEENNKTNSNLDISNNDSNIDNNNNIDNNSNISNNNNIDKENNNDNNDNIDDVNDENRRNSFVNNDNSELRKDKDNDDELEKCSSEESNQKSNNTLNSEKVANFGKIYKPHSPRDESNIKELKEIAKIFNESITNLGGLENINGKEDEEENIEVIVKGLSGFLKKKNSEINNEPIKTIDEIMEQIPENDAQNTDIVNEKVKNEYNNLSNLLVKSRLNETALYNKCSELSRFLNSCITKIQGVLNVSRNDRINIVNLNLELEKAWKIIEEKDNNESLYKDTVDILKKEIIKYRRRVKGKLDDLPDNLMDDTQIPDVDNKEEDYIKELEDKVTSLTKEVNKQQQDILKLESESIKKETELAALTDKNQELTDKITDLQGEYVKMRLERERESRDMRKLEGQLEKMNQTLEEKDKVTEEKVKEISDCNDMIEKYKDELSKEQMKIKNTDKAKEFIEATVEKQQGELEEQNVKINLLVTENYKNESRIRKLENQLSQLQSKNDKLLKTNEQLMKKQKSLEETIVSKDEKEEELNKKIDILIKAEEEKIKECDKMKKRISSLSREREILNRNYIQSLNNYNKQNGIIKVNEQTIKNTEHEIQSYRDEASKMRKIIYSLEKERDLQVGIQSNLKNSLNEKLTEVKLLRVNIDDERKKYSILQKKYDDCMKLYEDVKTDRNNYSKKLAESNDEVLELKRKNKSNSHTIDNMKEEVRIKEMVFAKTHFEKSKLEKEKENLLNQISSQQNELISNKLFIKNMQSTEENMRRTVVTMERDRKKLLHDYENIVKEKNLMQNQVILRNDEIALLYEKLKLQNSALVKGEYFYNERIEDIRVLKLEVKKLRREKSLLSIEAKNNSKLKREIFELQNQAVINNTKMKVLEDELETPMNVHRWRKLSGSDPESFELIMKIQSLQKRLLRKTEELISREQEVQEKDKMYEKLKKILERQPGLKVMEQLKYYRESLRSKINESKSLASELNMYQAQIEDYKVEILRLNSEISNQKSKYYTQKKKYESLSRKFDLVKLRNNFPLKKKKKLYMDVNKVTSRELILGNGL